MIYYRHQTPNEKHNANLREMQTSSNMTLLYFLDGVFFSIHDQNPIQALAGTKSQMWNTKTEVYNLPRKTVKTSLVDVTCI